MYTIECPFIAKRTKKQVAYYQRRLWATDIFHFIFKVNFLLAITLDFMTKCGPETTLEIKFVTPRAQNTIVC